VKVSFLYFLLTFGSVSMCSAWYGLMCSPNSLRMTTLTLDSSASLHSASLGSVSSKSEDGLASDHERVLRMSRIVVLIIKSL